MRSRPPARIREIAAFAAALGAAACNGPSSAPVPDASSSASSSSAVSAPKRDGRRPPVVAPTDAADGGLARRALPRIQYRGGRFLKHPRITTITFTKDDPKVVARLEQLGGMITRSSWWKAVTEGYCNDEGACIGEGSSAPPVHLDDALPADLGENELEAILARAAPKLGPLDDDTLLLVYLPAGVGFHDSLGAFCGNGPRGLHRSTDVTKDKRVAFAVVPRCGSESELTGTASHEVLESTTNPFPAERGFAFAGGSTISGFGFAGLEPVDPCGLVNASAHWTVEGGFVLQRAWSNRAAAAGADPCVPSRPGMPYAMLVPRELGVRLLKEGETQTLELDATTADATVSSWAASTFDATGQLDRTTYVEVGLDKATVRAGDTLALTVTLKKKPPSNRSVVGLVSTIGVHSHMWPLLVVTR
ncbi:MAG: hypothetical protein JST00_25660 [Deltaproteobacteria bacterium]|nr:hypothetical protein [Deltaproteobacteria bacterium]